MNHLKAWGAGLLYIAFLCVVVGIFSFLVKWLHADRVVVLLLLTAGAYWIGKDLVAKSNRKTKRGKAS